MNPHLFVYGSLMNPDMHEMGRLLAQNSQLVGPASVPGRLYRVSWYPGGIYDAAAPSLIRGKLFRLHEPARVFPLLDEYEGYDPRAIGQSLFVRKLVQVNGPQGRLKAWMYTYQGSTAGLSLIASGDFLAG